MKKHAHTAAHTDRIARVAHAANPSWPTKKIYDYLRAQFPDADPRGLMIAMVVLAQMPTKTPESLHTPGPWWDAANAATGLKEGPKEKAPERDVCPWHPDKPSACPICKGERRQPPKNFREEYEKALADKSSGNSGRNSH